MGRNSTGITPTEAQQRIELKLLLRDGFIKKGSHIYGSLTWTNGNTIGIESKYTEKEKYIRLDYTNTHRYTGEETKHNYVIELIALPSNLGKGDVLYFVCPETNSLCRVLYKTYGSLTWKSRFAYKYHIYYRVQTRSKYDYHNTRYWKIHDQLEDLYKRRVKHTYKGKKTAIQQKIEYLELKQLYHDKLRWEIVPKKIKPFIKLYGYN